MGVVLPVVYLLMRALEADVGELGQVVLRWRNVELLLNTVLLTGGVLITTTLLALPAAWLTSCSDIPGRRFLSLVGVLPLAIPSYVMAYTLLGLGGHHGALAQLTGLTMPRPSGYWGAWMALSLYNFPYMFLTLRASLSGLDPALEEIARSVGTKSLAVFWRVILPQLRPALLTGALLISLHVIADFGVVSLMRFETFSFALHQQYKVFDPNGLVYAAWLALMLILLAGVIVVAEVMLLRNLRLDRTGTGTGRTRRLAQIGRWKIAALIFLIGLGLISVALPTASVIFWATRSQLDAFAPSFLNSDLKEAIVASVSASLPAAVIATALAMPIAYLARRYFSRSSLILERTTYLGYATPALAFALGLMFFALKTDTVLEKLKIDRVLAPLMGNDGRLYQSMYVLIYGYSLHFLAEAIGPLRNALYHASPRLVEAARSLGYNPFITFWRVSFPLMRHGIVVSLALVFLSCMKELPLTILLQPLDFQTLALNVYDRTAEGMYAEAAPYALTILLLSAVFVGVLQFQGERRT